MEQYTALNPKISFPGCLTTFIASSQLKRLEEIEKSQEKKNYVVRAIISDNIPLTLPIPDLLSQSSKSLLNVNGNPLTMYLHHSGFHAVFYDLFPRENNELAHIDVQVLADHPNACFAPARTAINQLLDTLMREVWIPLVIVRLDVFDETEERAILHEIHFPFLIKLNFGPIGGFDSFPMLAAYEALSREAILATSPYYRFLCAYRLCEGLNHFRHQIKKYVEKFNTQEPMPRPPSIQSELLESMGCKPEFIKKVKKFDDLIAELKVYRNAVAHFLLEEYGKKPIHISDGFNYRLYSSLGALLLYYAHEAFNDLRIYFNQNISSKLFIGSILPEIEKRHNFIIKAPSFWDELKETEE